MISSTPQAVNEQPVQAQAIVEIKPLSVVGSSAGETSDAERGAEGSAPMYWAVTTDEQALKAAERLGRGLGAAGAVRSLSPSAVRAIGFAFEGDLPIAQDELHAVGVLIRNTVVFCATERRHLAELPSHQLTLSPDKLPDFVRAAAGPALQPIHFNLLQAEFEPLPLRSIRSRVWNLLTLTACISMLLTAAGLWRRSNAWASELGERAIATTTAAEQMYPGDRLAAQDAVRRAKQELADAEALRSLAPAEPMKDAPADCAVTLASLLARWPRSTAGETESFQTEVLSLTDSSISATVLTNADARGFLDQLKAPDGWTMQQPRLSQSPSGVRLAVQMTKSAPPKSTAPEGGPP